MYRAAFPSQWLLTPASPSSAHHYTVSAPYGWGYSEFLPLLGPDGSPLPGSPALLAGPPPSYPPPNMNRATVEQILKKSSWRGNTKSGGDDNSETFSSSAGLLAYSERRPNAYHDYMTSATGADGAKKYGRKCENGAEKCLSSPNGRNDDNIGTMDQLSRGAAFNKGVKRQLDVSGPVNTSSSSSRSNSSVEANNSKRKYNPSRALPHAPPNCRPPAKHEVLVHKNVVNGGVWDQLSTQIWERYVASNQSDEVFQRKMRLHEVLYRILHEHFPSCGLYVVGSSMTGFGCNTSDIDMCLMLRHDDIDQKMDAINILRLVLKALKRCEFVQKAELIRAKVPILKFSDSVSGIEVDLNINNSVGIRNTHLLNNYSKLDWRVRPLVIIVKAWARVHDINDAKNMTISSYSLALMVIHYLQCGATPPVLPCLQKLFPTKFNHESNVRELVLDEELTFQQMFNNSNTLGELFYGFIEYYARRFNFEEYAISIRVGAPIPKQIVMYQRAPKNNPTQWKCLCVEEPFDLTNTARSVYDDYIFSRVKRVFETSCTHLQRTKELAAILTQHVAPS